MAHGEPNPYQWRFYVMGLVCFVAALFVGLDGASKYTPLLMPLTYFGCLAFFLGTWIHIKS